ncbi:2-hydroxycarboxylate transporter family protein [Clostridium hydrogenum]|uniref:2-hydroxycarboxylate transporter family protein n=1 Tax=Clostridium hydrogenum TaxID=2855764 RepID=UPI001F1C164A|nr:2-hydroxycarboxylate transporter family protein [Clostridium hydrogenum]
MDNSEIKEETESKQVSPIKNFFSIKIGVMPLGVFLLLLIVDSLLIQKKILPTDMIGAGSIMVLFGFACEEIGKRIPILKNVGGKAIMATFLPSYLVYANLLPKQAVTSVDFFMKQTNFLYVFIACLIVGSILSMNRTVLIKALVRIFIPMAAALVMGSIVGTLVGTVLGLGAFKTYFFIVVPIMAGGVGEGALPLSMGYSSILKQGQAGIFAQVLPCVMLGSLVAIILSGVLKYIGQKYPKYSGNGSLLKAGKDDEILRIAQEGDKAKASANHDLSQLTVAGILSFALYLAGVYINSLIGLPAPIVMLIAVVMAKVLGLIPKNIEKGGYSLFRFIATAVTTPLLFGIGVSMTPWKNLVAVFSSPRYLIVITLTVVTIVLVGWFVGNLVGMYPVEAAIVTACNSGQGGTGVVSILTASDRLELMPFGQLATRIGGALTVVVGIALLRLLH